MSLKIGIDISQVVYGTGVSVYTKELVRALLKLDHEDDYVLFGGYLRRKKDLRSFVASLEGRFRSKLVLFPPVLANMVWNRLHIVKFEKFTGPLDVYHSSDWAQAPSGAFKITTIHDLAPFKFPELSRKDLFRSIVSTHTSRMKWIAREVDRVIVPSEATKNDLVELGMGEAKIRVIYEAPGEVFKPQSQEAVSSLLKRLKISGEYILTVGVGGRKNTDKLVKAFELARAGKNLNLVLVGTGGGKYTDNRGVRALGAVGDRDLATLYTGAAAFTYPSLYEGFGLPILQAFACGTPVVTSDLSAMAEIAGNAAVLVNPHSVNSIADGIKKALAGRIGLAKKGFERVKGFSWEKAAIETVAVYREAEVK
jgi:glycosyltransferase involved in cell wall biosynthesis